MRYIILILLLISLSLCYSCKKTASDSEQSKYAFRQDGELQIFDKSNHLKATFRIEIAQTENEEMQGLKYRESMDADAGMLFIFKQPDIYDFWMQDTYLPLDMLFISAEGEVNYIYENAKPFSEERITPDHIHQYVLEVNAGTVKKNNLQNGDIVKWKRL